VKPGQIVKVKVIDVDVKRQRIALTMRLDNAPGATSRPTNPPGATARPTNTPSATSRPTSRPAAAAQGARDRRPSASKSNATREPQAPSAMALAFAKLKK